MVCGDVQCAVWYMARVWCMARACVWHVCGVCVCGAFVRGVRVRACVVCVYIPVFVEVEVAVQEV